MKREQFFAHAKKKKKRKQVAQLYARWCIYLSFCWTSTVWPLQVIILMYKLRQIETRRRHMDILWPAIILSSRLYNYRPPKWMSRELLIFNERVSFDNKFIWTWFSLYLENWIVFDVSRISWISFSFIDLFYNGIIDRYVYLLLIIKHVVFTCLASKTNQTHCSNFQFLFVCCLTIF